IAAVKRKMQATADDQGRITRMKTKLHRQILADQEEIRTTPKGPERAGKDLEKINKGMHMKLPIHISEGKKQPEVPRQAAKLATEAGIILRRHIPVLPRWNKLQHEQDHLSNYIKKVSVGISTHGQHWREVQFSMDTTSKSVISACADMLKFDQRQMRYKLKKKYFNNIPESQRITKSPVSSMDDNQWAELLKLWSSPQHMETGLANQRNREKVRMYQRTGSRCYIAQAHALRDKFKDAEPTAMDLFREFHSSRKTGSVSETVQKALDDMEAMMEEPLEALMAELEREKAESQQVEQIVEQQRREIDALRKQVQEARDSNCTVEVQLEHLRKESTRKASMIACLMSNFEGGQVHPSSLTFE
ncbi:hypothetical protein EJB05_44349, partial [Eragrostis curvula]